MSALAKLTPMFLANAAFCIENGSDVKPETRESIIDTLIKASEELSQANAAKIAPTQGADARPVAIKSIRLPAIGEELYEHYPAMSAQAHEAAIKAYARTVLASHDATPIVDARPVAWRWRERNTDRWRFTRHSPESLPRVPAMFEPLGVITIRDVAPRADEQDAKRYRKLRKWMSSNVDEGWREVTRLAAVACYVDLENFDQYLDGLPECNVGLCEAAIAPMEKT